MSLLYSFLWPQTHMLTHTHTYIHTWADAHMQRKKPLTQIWYNGYGFVRGRSVYGQRQVQAIIQVSKPLSGSHGGARQSSHTHTQKHNSQLQPRDLPKIIPLLFTMRGFTRLGPKISEPLLTTSGLPAGPWTPVWRLKCLILVNWMAFWAQSPDNVSNEMSREDNGKAANLVFMRSLFVSGEHL